MEPAWRSLIPLHVALPLIGAVLFLAACRWGPRAARAMVITNVAGSLLLSALLIGAYFTAITAPESGAGPERTSARMPWLRLPHDSVDDRDSSVDDPASRADITLSFGVDGVNLWLVATVPLLVLCMLLTDQSERWSERPLPVAALLVGESAALALMMARDIVLFSAALGVLAIANAVAIGSRGGPGVRAAARRLAMQHLAAGALITISLAGTTVACAHMRGAPHSAPQPTTFDLDELIHDVRRMSSASPPAQLVWRQLSPWLFLGVFAGCWVWSGGFPFHIASASAIRDSDAPGRALLGGVTIQVGAWSLIRIALPLYPDLITSLGPFLLLGVLLSALYCAVSMNGARAATESGPPPGRQTAGDMFLAEGAVVIALLSMCGVLSQSISGVVGAVLLLVAHMVCWTLYVVSIATPAEPPEPGLLVVLSLAGVPGLALFPGLLLVSLGLAASPATVESWLAMLLLYWLVIAMSGWAHLDQARKANRVLRASVSASRLVAVLLMGAIILIGIAPGLLTTAIENGVYEVLFGNVSS